MTASEYLEALNELRRQITEEEYAKVSDAIAAAGRALETNGINITRDALIEVSSLAIVLLACAPDGHFKSQLQRAEKTEEIPFT